MHTRLSQVPKKASLIETVARSVSAMYEATDLDSTGSPQTDVKKTVFWAQVCCLLSASA